MARHKIAGAQRLPLGRLTVALAAVALTTQMADRAAAQTYKVLRPRLQEAAAKQMEGKVAAILRDTAAPTPANAKIVEDYFNGWYFPAMTSDAPARLGVLAEERNKLFQRYINVTKTPAARELVLTLSQKAASSIAAGNYHPAVRYNATLVLGSLDQTVAAGTGGTPPKPVAGATNALTALLERDDVNGVPVTSSVKIAALVGLERHTRLGVDPQFADRISTAALAMANRKEPPADISAEINSWMRCQAARVLANQFAKGITAPVNDSLVTLIGSSELGLDDRCRVADMLSPTMFAGVEVDPEEMTMAIGKLAKAVLAEERKKAQEYQDEMVAGNPGGFGGGGFGRGGGFGGFDGGRGGGFMPGMPPTETGPHFEKRRFLDRVMAVHKAAEAVATVGSDELKGRVNELVEALKETADKVVDDKTSEVAVANLVVDLARTVNGIVNGWSANEAPPANEDAGDDELAGGQ